MWTLLEVRLLALHQFVLCAADGQAEKLMEDEELEDPLSDGDRVDGDKRQHNELFQPVLQDYVHIRIVLFSGLGDSPQEDSRVG